MTTGTSSVSTRSRLVASKRIPAHPLTEGVAAVSVGIVDAVALLDLPYVEDVKAEVDMNVVMTSSGRFVEVQGTAEGKAFSKSELSLFQPERVEMPKDPTDSPTKFV